MTLGGLLLGAALGLRLRFDLGQGEHPHRFHQPARRTPPGCWSETFCSDSSWLVCWVDSRIWLARSQQADY